MKKCFVLTCSNTSENCENKLFILIPTNKDIRKRWFSAVNRPFTTTKEMYCCEDHFDLEVDMKNWMQFSLIGSRVHMKKEVVPHKYVHERKPDKETPSQLTPSTRKRKLETLEQMRDGVKKRVCVDMPSYEHFPMSHCSPIIMTEGACSKVISFGPFISFQGTENISVTRPEDKTVETMSSDSQYYNPNIIKFECKYVDENNSNSNYIPSSSNNENTSDGTDRDVAHMRSLEKMSRFYLGLPPETYSIIKIITQYVNISSPDILICLKKIRLNDANVRIADDFSISKSSVSKIFNNTVPILASIFKKFIIWQSVIQIQAHLPILFRYRYRKVQSIINCLEIEIDKPSDAEKQAQTWSQYNHCNTVKYLISATPHGLINYVSPGFGGRAPDTIMVEKSGFLDVLPNHAHVMADRGFKQIASILARKDCFLIRPPSDFSPEKRSKEKVKETKRTAALRNHIERVMHRLREFRMLKLHSCIDHETLHLLDHIIIIACGIVNVQNPSIK